MTEVPEDHPRRQSLLTREKIERGVDLGITSRQGLIAQGRGEAFDYLLGERTHGFAERAQRTAVVHLLLADHGVVSVNGNVAALCAREALELAAAVDADVEANIFHRSEDRVEAIVEHLRESGAIELGVEVHGLEADARVPGLSSERAKVDADGIYAADVVVVPLEDGDRCEALREMGKTEVVVDLNPMSRSARDADVPVVDNVVRAFPRMTEMAREMEDWNEPRLRDVVEGFDAQEVLARAERAVRERAVEAGV